MTLGTPGTARRLIAVALVFAGCAGGTPTETPRATGGKTGSGPVVDEAKPRLHPDGPLRGLILATALEADGSITEPRLGFTTGDTKATAVIGLGPDVPEDARIVVAWYRLTAVEGGRNHLFSHEIDVGPGGLAYSEGVAGSGLAPGLYETVATLGEHQVRAPWGAQTRQRAADQNRTTASVGLVVQTGSTLADWEMPGPGEAGYVGTGDLPPTPAGPPPDTCTINDVGASVSPMTELLAEATWLGPCSDLTLTAAVSGPPTTLASDTVQPDPARPWGTVYGQANLCVGFPGGSDLPGTIVSLDVSGSGSATGSYALPDFGPFLQAGVESIPEGGSKVAPGDRIKLHALGFLLPPALGIKVLYVDDGNDLIESVGNIAGVDEPISCELRRLLAQLITEYEVPADPPPFVEICATAEGFDGTESRGCISFPTEGPFRLDGVWDDNGRLVNVAQDGTALRGDFVTDYYCDLDRGSLRGDETPAPDANVQTTTQDFTAVLSGAEDVFPGDTISGEVVTCRWGGAAPGIARVSLELTVQDKNTLTGEFISDVDYDEDGEIDRGSITMTRQE